MLDNEVATATHRHAWLPAGFLQPSSVGGEMAGVDVCECGIGRIGNTEGYLGMLRRARIGNEGQTHLIWAPASQLSTPNWLRALCGEVSTVGWMASQAYPGCWRCRKVARLP